MRRNNTRELYVLSFSPHVEHCPDCFKPQTQTVATKLTPSNRFLTAGMLRRNILKRNWQVTIFRKKKLFLRNLKLLSGSNILKMYFRTREPIHDMLYAAVSICQYLIGLDIGDVMFSRRHLIGSLPIYTMYITCCIHHSLEFTY